MEVHLSPDVQAKLEQIAEESGRRGDELLEDAVIGLDTRYDEWKAAGCSLLMAGKRSGA